MYLHSEIIWEWIKQSYYYKISINSKKISWEEHSLWFKKNLIDKNTKLYVGDEEGVAFGFLRFENYKYKKLTYKVCNVLSPYFRG